MIKKSKTYTIWFVSYLIILILPMIFTMFLYGHIQNVWMSEVSNINFVNLENAQNNMDNIFYQIENVFSLISLNNNLNKVFNRYDLQSTAMYEMYEAARDISVYNATADVIFDLYVYLPKSDLIISSKNIVRDADDYFRFGGKNIETDISEWKAVLSNSNEHMIPDLRLLNNQGDEVECAAFLRTMPTLETGDNVEGIIVAIIEKNRLTFNLANNKLYREGSFYLFNEQDENIVKYGNTEKFPLDGINIIKDENLIKTTINKEQVYIMQLSSAVSNWRQVVVIPVKSFADFIYDTRNTAIWMLIGSSVIGLALIMVLLKYNYSPLNSLIEKLKEFSKSKDYTDEYSLIDVVLRNAIKDKEEMSNLLSKQTKEMKVNFFKRMLRGEIDENLFASTFDLYDIKFISDNFAVFIIRFDDIGLLFADDETITPAERVRLAQFITANVMEEMANENDRAYLLPFEDTVAGIVNIKDESLSVWEASLYDAVQKSRTFIEDNFEFSFSVAVSDVNKSYTAISYAYNESLVALEHMALLGEDSCVFYGNIKDTGSKSYHYSIDIENKLINFIKAGDDKNASILIDEIFEKHFNTGNPPAILIRCLIFNLESTILKVAYDMFKTSNFDSLDEVLGLEAMAYSKGVSTLKSKLKDIISDICSEVRSNDEKHGDSIVYKIKKYIEENYADPNLTIPLIAEHMKLHPTYATAVFKESTGDGILNYLMAYRIGKSKQLLAETDKNIEEISNAVGYSYWRTFTRVFKKIEGIPPSKYRENLSGK